MEFRSGYEGTIKVGGGSTPPQAKFFGSWDASSKTELKKRGPYIGDSGKIYKSRGGRDGSVSLKGDVPKGYDAAIAAILAAEENGTDLVLELTQTDGLVTAGTWAITELKVGSKGDEGHTIELECESNGTYSFDGPTGP